MQGKQIKQQLKSNLDSILKRIDDNIDYNFMTYIDIIGIDDNCIPVFVHESSIAEINYSLATLFNNCVIKKDCIHIKFTK